MSSTSNSPGAGTFQATCQQRRGRERDERTRAGREVTEIDREQQTEQSEIEDTATYKLNSTAEITGNRDREQQTERNDRETQKQETKQQG